MTGFPERILSNAVIEVCRHVGSSWENFEEFIPIASYEFEITESSR